MAEESTFRGIIEFFVRLGVYDVVLPFLLVFTIVFAILEKTKVLGTEKIDKVTYTKKNLNSMVAFCIAFFVILSRELVATLNEALANIVVLLLVSVSFLLLIGSFKKESDEPVFISGTWDTVFMVLMFVGVIAIFLHAIPTSDGSNWLLTILGWLAQNWNQEAVSALIFILGIALFMWWMTRSPHSGKDKGKSSSD